MLLVNYRMEINTSVRAPVLFDQSEKTNKTMLIDFFVLSDVFEKSLFDFTEQQFVIGIMREIQTDVDLFVSTEAFDEFFTQC